MLEAERRVGVSCTRESQMRVRRGDGYGGWLEWAVALAVLLLGGLIVLLALAALGKATGPVCPNCFYPVSPPAAARPAAVTIPAGGPAAGSPVEGNRFARGLLAQVRPPTGARRVTSPPAEVQAPPMAWDLSPDMTDVATVWRIVLPMDRAVAFFEHDPPARLRLTLADSTGRVSGIIGDTVDTVLEFGRGPVPAGIWGAQVLLSLHSDGATASLVRADVQVAWYPPRSRAEYIAGLRAMTIDGPRGVRTFTAPAVIARMAGLLNGLEAAPGGQYAAPVGQYAAPVGDCARSGDGYGVAFATKRGAVPWTRVSLAPGCRGVDVTVDYQDQPALDDPSGKAESYVASLMR